ncbi:YxeA family protein [Candidatus Enterococcus ikei]|uniref:YxeA family protein n=1 Tax=Candidatus Enterococcus ikei TaxID=2815326 RepID=A0ABS3GWR2_9ENTE|nr:YxeA family protein [Enterococcus sp. DIV0869a]MBO0439713.1 YxeA family protein [Enterococcus sp. DIV0869a]
MKKTLFFILPFILLTFGVWFGYDYYYGGKDYYTRIITPGKVVTGKFTNGEKYIEYDYKQTAFNKDGEKNVQTLREIRNKPLRINAYLKLKVNPRKGVISWEEVPEKKVPKKALKKLLDQS